MRLTVLATMAKSLRAAPPEEEGLIGRRDPAAAAAEGLKRLTWLCWHGNLVRALAMISDLELDAQVAQPSPEQAKFSKALAEFDTYLRVNAGSIPNYGERRRAGEAISSSTAESAVNHSAAGTPASPTPQQKRHPTINRWPRNSHGLSRSRTWSEDSAAGLDALTVC
jgi:hypothetical protein